MGDLKKKNTGNLNPQTGVNGDLVDMDEIENNTINRLKAYLKIFAEEQGKKERKKEEASNGKMADV